jgi:kexin
LPLTLGQTTTDVGKRDCSFSHGGTSAAAPNAVGVFALALSVRPDLTWRDMQHLAVRSAHVINPDDPDWERTAQGRLFSYKYGFGAVDAYAYVAAARAWKSVKPQAWLAVPAVQLEGGTMSLLDEMTGGTHITHEGVSSTTAVTQAMMADANLETLEHVTVKVWIKHERRGDVEIELVSPGGVRSVLAGQRPRDAAKTGFRGWRFMSVKHWFVASVSCPASC